MEHCLQPPRKCFSLTRGLTQRGTKPILWVLLKGSIVQGQLGSSEPGSRGWGRNQNSFRESLTAEIQIFSLYYEIPHQKCNCCYPCNTDIRVHPGWRWTLGHSGFSLGPSAIMEHPRPSTPHRIMTWGLARPPSSTREASRHGEACGLAP